MNIEMIYIAVTRFNEDTWRENLYYRERKELRGCIYNSPISIRSSLPIKATMYVLEMNNTTNRIMGVGYIQNHVKGVKRYNMYSTGSYNRFSYIGTCRIDQSEFTHMERRIMCFLEILLFRGCGIRGKHMKRGSGIQCVSEKVISKCKHILNLKKFIECMFSTRFQKYIENGSDTNSNLDSDVHQH